MPTWFQITWVYIKKYSWIFFAILSGVFLFLLLRKSPGSIAEQIAEISKAHAEEIARIKAANDERDRQLIENQQRMEEQLAQLDERYQKAIAELDSSRQAEVRRILDAHKDDPQGLAEELAQVLGFKVEQLPPQ